MAVYKRELKSLFFSPIAFIAIALSMFMLSLLVTGNFYQADMRDVFGTMPILMLFLIPMATMRTLSEEIKLGTNELLMTSPVSLGGIVFGKYLAVMTLLSAIFALSGEYVVLISVYGKPDWGPVFTGYAGLVFLFSAFVSVGIFMSSLTKNQFVAAMLTFVTILFFIVIDSDLATNIFGVFGVADIVDHISIFKHYEDFYKGVLNLSHFVYYVGFTFLFLFFTVRNLETRRW